MSSQKQPLTEYPFPGRLDGSKADSEIRAGSAPLNHSCSIQSMSTPPTSGANAIPDSNDAPKPTVCVTQALMQSACKRKRVSPSETEQQLVQRLEKFGVKSALDVRSLATAFLSNGAEESQSGVQKPKAPNWTKNEAARLFHVIADPRHATAAGRLYNKIQTRAEIDIGKHDPWSAEFVDLFNAEDYLLDIPDARNGVIDPVLVSYDPTMHPHKRRVAFLKGRCNKLRLKYTVARERFPQSGQGENDVFEHFTGGDDSIAYMHCVFFGLRALEAIGQALPDGSGIKAGLEEISNARSTSLDVSRRCKKRKTSGENSIAQSLSEVAKAVTAPVEININEKNESVTSGKFHEFDMSDRIAGTVTKLMTLEDNIRSHLRQAVLDNDEEYMEELRGRLTKVQRRIERALLE